jgi:hypothetical protein
MLSSLVDALISEKRIQLNNQQNIHIDLNIENSYGLFAKIDPIELKSVLSNLINNCIEAFDNKIHHVNVIVNKNKQAIQIIIHDDGKGIPKEILKQIGQYGFSYGKESLASAGSGLGVYHAIKTIESFGGSFTIDSELNKGTTVILTLPHAGTPNWFVQTLSLEGVETVIVLDDDQSIHNLWQNRMLPFSNRNAIEIICFSFANELRDYFHRELKAKLDKCLFLMDYELLNQDRSGLDVVEELKIANHAILVSSYYEDPAINKRITKLGMRMIPKSLATFVPIIDFVE